MTTRKKGLLRSYTPKVESRNQDARPTVDQAQKDSLFERGEWEPLIMATSMLFGEERESRELMRKLIAAAPSTGPKAITWEKLRALYDLFFAAFQSRGALPLRVLRNELESVTDYRSGAGRGQRLSGASPPGEPDPEDLIWGD